MELLKLVGTNGIEHWVNPLKVSRVTFTQETTTAGLPNEDGTPADPIVTPASLVVHLDTGFSIQVPDDLATLVDKLDKVG
jgi:hypothetical protein